MGRLNKAAKARLKRMSRAEKMALIKAARLLTDAEVITPQRYVVIARTINIQ